MKRARDNTNRFLDLEAVDDNENEEIGIDDEYEDDGFIEDNSVIAESGTLKRFTNFNDNSNDGWADLVADLEKRYGDTAQPSIPHDSVRETLASHSTIVSVVDDVIRSPSSNDSPLWRVRCRLGLEEDVVFFLLQTVHPYHGLRAAFMRDMIRGWVYLEGDMNERLQYLLRRTPGVILRDSGTIIIERIEITDRKSLLAMHSGEIPKVGKWVEIRKGIYKGDVGYVDSIENWGIEVLLVPRLPPPQPSHVTHSNKRKRTSPPPSPALFDPIAIKQTYKVAPPLIHTDCYKFKGHRFEHGLIRKQYDFSSISTIHHIPLTLFILFRESHHPKLIASESGFPKPLEWEFAEGDEVYVWPKDAETSRRSWKHGIITALELYSAKVDLSHNEGIVDVPWIDLLKDIREGDYIEITGGPYRGRTGWLNGTEPGQPQLGETTVIETVGRDKNNEKDINMLPVHVNVLKRISETYLHGQQKHDLSRTRSDRVPWLKTEVIISGPHALKTYRGIVLDILCNQTTPSGLRVHIQLLSNGPSSRMIVLDYDFVVEAKGGRKLFSYSPTKDRLFVPRNYDLNTSQPFRPLIEDTFPIMANPAPGYATPTPELPYLSSPAWNPSHMLTPDTEPSLEGPSRLPAVQEQVAKNHILLDSRLLDAQLKVVVTGGTYSKKELTASIHSGEAGLVIRWQSYRVWNYLEPDWVTPKYPSPTRDNGLMVVISGEHCGKYVRRIYHRYEGDKPIVLLGVVNRVAGQADTLTDERLELEVSSLCLCEESKEDKKKNSTLMNAVRAEASKIRAK